MIFYNSFRYFAICCKNSWNRFLTKCANCASAKYYWYCYYYECFFQLFATTLFDTLPLDCVVGRCLILDSTMYCAGRPRVPRYHESVFVFWSRFIDFNFYEKYNESVLQDVFFCDTGYNTKISKFEKLLPKYHYTISTDPLIFERFPEKLQIARSFSVCFEIL